MRVENELSHIGPRDVGPIVFSSEEQKRKLCEQYQQLKRVGIGIDADDLQKMFNYYRSKPTGMDANLTTPLTTASITTPVQFLQAWLPGFTEVITAARRIDNLVGVTTQGSWEDEEVVQGVLEHTGNAPIYGDYTNLPKHLSLIHI